MYNFSYHFIHGLFNDSIGNSNCTALNTSIWVNNWLIRTWKKILTHFGVLSWNLPTATGENYGKTLVKIWLLVSGQNWTHSTSSTHSTRMFSNLKWLRGTSKEDRREGEREKAGISQFCLIWLITENNHGLL